MTPACLSPVPASSARVRAAGKFLRCDGGKWFLQGVSYGPFKPNARGEPFPEDERLTADFASIRVMGFNTVRTYDLPSEALLREASAQGLRLIVGIPWTDHVDFLRDRQRCHEIEARVRGAAQRLGRHATVAAMLVGNEIEKTLVRWMGPVKVRRFLERLIDIARAAAPDCLIAYATYPSTEYLLPANADFVAVNVYLEERAAFERYLHHLQNLAGNRPLVITEFGVDVLQHGEAVQAEIRRWQSECLQRCGVAGNVWFAFTDEWFRGGAEVTRWAFGLVTSDRIPRPAAQLPLTENVPATPMISVVVCTCNGGRTLRECLEALGRQRHPHFEIIVVDDGSTDGVQEIARSFAQVRCLRQEHSGLSVARNLGARAAMGDIIAYTDDDCMADEDWLSHLALGFDDPQWVAAGGPNIPPPTKNRTEVMVAAAPGGPSHVLLHDEEAEHLPGCNLAIRCSALEAVGGFRAPFRVAGDDVDICWRLREAGGRLRFVPGAMVWHHRRGSVLSYFRQQSGYGYAEALLVKHHPRHFGVLGGARWRGLVYGGNAGPLSVEGAVFHGPFGNGLFQTLYASSDSHGWFDPFAGLLWVAMALALVLLKMPFAAILVCAIACSFAWRRMAGHPAASLADKALLWFLCLAQPVVREWARVKGILILGARPAFEAVPPQVSLPRRPVKASRKVMELAFWSEVGVGREEWMREFRQVLVEEPLTAREDDGWGLHDFELFGTAGLVSVTEYHGGLKQLTRVSISHRWVHSVWLVMLVCPLIYSFALAHMNRWMGLPVHSWWSGVLTGGTMVGGMMLTGWVIIWLPAKARARALVLKAAQRAGLQWIERGC